ncbi:VWA domain-containing protein [Paenibacillus sp. N3.4]|uniref:vWA domain-containing protein n=1 Tax=Paenibacillus sp. N3.4 TaxID=2603222 RepID=UPI0011CC6E8F|nr:VWA domain-containing protein [Paenibacillus sp. N3.4]TXK82568.1 VWA domain-containing protein [Paenibacillus sp. N3.4]
MNAPIQTTHAWNNEFWPTGGTEKAFLLLEMKGNAGIQSERAPMNVSVVMDRSGSMSGAPLAYSKRACQFITDQMSKEDILSIVAFDNEVETVFTPQHVTHKDMMKHKIESIQTGGSTNLSGGLLKGIQYVVEEKSNGSINRVLLLSDGHANAGITDREKLQSICRCDRNAGDDKIWKPGKTGTPHPLEHTAQFRNLNRNRLDQEENNPKYMKRC